MADRKQLQARVAAALTGVINPRTGTDLISAGTVTRVDFTDAGEVLLEFALGADDPGTLVREARRAVQAVDGVSSVRVDVKGTPAASPPAGHMPKPSPAPTPRELPHLGKVIAVSSGKGGVGKSTCSVNLAAALAARGHRVGIMDADIYGPNLPRMFGIVGQEPPVVERKIHPLEAHGVKVMSLGNLVERDVATIWRGPIITKIIQQFLGDVAWGQLDYFIVDLPPGTGDAQLSLVQNAHVAAGIIVTTPQEVAVGDALRGAKMFEKVGVPLLGIIENMSYFETGDGKREYVFGKGGGQRLATELGVPLLAQIPLATMVQEMGEAGTPVVLKHPESAAAVALTKMAEQVEREVAAKAVKLPIVAG
jgi:ATP-binding protein involved in chromosome partitioning